MVENCSQIVDVDDKQMHACIKNESQWNATEFIARKEALNSWSDNRLSVLTTRTTNSKCTDQVVFFIEEELSHTETI